MKKLRELNSNLAFHLIGSMIGLLILFGLIVSTIGYISFARAFRSEYTTTTYHMANTAAALVNGDHLDDYLAGEEEEEFEQTKEALDIYCHKMNVSLIYVISVDTSDYGRFVSVFNPVNNSVDNSSYTSWELGYKRDTTNEEYREKYRILYEQQSAYETVFRPRTSGSQHSHITTLVPLKKSDGSVAGLLCIERPMREIRDATRPYLIIIALTTAALALIASLSAGILLRKQVILPLQKVSEEATRFAKENTKGEDLGTISRFKELSNLSRSIDTMEKDMVRYMENLTAITAEKERIGVELNLARTIQGAAIPSVFPAFPNRPEFDLFASMDPARQVGGDFYNFDLLDEDHLGLVIGDVSGKGIPAALFMMVSNILIMERARMGGTPAEILNFVNQELCAHNTAQMFVTVYLGILELSTGKLTAVNAGHEYPVVQAPGGGFELIKDVHGCMVGLLDDVIYEEYEMQLAPGSKLFIYTDGVSEATDANRKMFGNDRMLEALNSQPDASPEKLLKNVRGAVDAFVQEAEQFDDLTMLCLEYKG